MFQMADALLEGVKVMPSRDDACSMEAPVSKSQFIHDLKEGDEVDSLFSVKFKKPPKAYTKGFMFEVRFADRSGEMTAKFWGPKDEAAVRKLYQSFDSDDVVRVQGFVSSYRDALEIGISHDKKGRIEKVPRGGFEIADFVARASRDVEQMMSQLLAQVRKVQNKHLHALLAQFFSDEEFMSRFKAAPASMWLHCNWVGGLVEHTLNVVPRKERSVELNHRRVMLAKLIEEQVIALGEIPIRVINYFSHIYSNQSCILHRGASPYRPSI